MLILCFATYFLAQLACQNAVYLSAWDYVSVCMLTIVAQIVTAAHRDL